jgi:hypothetical protein
MKCWQCFRDFCGVRGRGFGYLCPSSGSGPGHERGADEGGVCRSRELPGSRRLAVGYQFIQIMGSPYPPAHGLGTPVKEATTKV